MFNILIKNYVNKLSKEDIVAFGIKNNITLTNEELDFIYNTIKKDYQLILSDNQEVFDNLRRNVSSTTYDKIIVLYNHYKSTYKF